MTCRTLPHTTRREAAPGGHRQRTPRWPAGAAAGGAASRPGQGTALPGRGSATRVVHGDSVRHTAEKGPPRQATRGERVHNMRGGAEAATADEVRSRPGHARGGGSGGCSGRSIGAGALRQRNHATRRYTTWDFTPGRQGAQARARRAGCGQELRGPVWGDGRAAAHAL